MKFKLKKIVRMSIGAGIIGVLAIASSFYIWNSDKFTRNQKVILLICIIFVPLQWILIPIILWYNMAQKENSKDSKLNKLSTNLYQLKHQGLLNGDEYESKLSIIENKKKDNSIKASVQYKQLQNLLNSGVLNQEEFESKVELLANINHGSLKSYDIEELIIGKFEVDDIIYTFGSRNILEIKYKSNSEVKGTWQKIDSTTLELKFLVVKTLFKDVIISEDRISYVNSKTNYTGYRIS